MTSCWLKRAGGQRAWRGEGVLAWRGQGGQRAWRGEGVFAWRGQGCREHGEGRVC